MSKRAGHPCPQCNAIPCAEYAMQGEAPQWRCNDCGANGWLSGVFDGRAPAAPVTPPPRIHKSPGRLS
jgi:sarcosine oxidase delta subunit